METLKKKLITLDVDKIEVPKGLQVMGEPQATLIIEKYEDIGYYYVKLSSSELGINHLFGRGSQDKNYAEAQFEINLKRLKEGEYDLSYHPHLRMPRSYPFNAEEI